MPSVAEHYANLLSEVYAWMLGGFEQALAANAALIARHGLEPRGGGTGTATAVDLGAGCGFQSIPLARTGYRVTAIDIDPGLIGELERHRGGLPIRTVVGDLLDFERHIDAPVELAVCMTDTLLHLGSEAEVRALLSRLPAALAPGGRFVASFRDLSRPLEGLDRFIPVRADDTRILSCFLEYEPETVKVHDLLYRRSADGWQLTKSFYRKLRLSAESVRELLDAAGFAAVEIHVERGLVTCIARK